MYWLTPSHILQVNCIRSCRLLEPVLEASSAAAAAATAAIFCGDRVSKSRKNKKFRQTDRGGEDVDTPRWYFVRTACVSWMCHATLADNEMTIKITSKSYAASWAESSVYINRRHTTLTALPRINRRYTTLTALPRINLNLSENTSIMYY